MPPLTSLHSCPLSLAGSDRTADGDHVSQLHVFVLSVLRRVSGRAPRLEVIHSALLFSSCAAAPPCSSLHTSQLHPAFASPGARLRKR